MIGEVFRGRNAEVTLLENGVKIQRLSTVFKIKKAEKTIPYSKITAVQFKNPGFFMAGYLQIEVSGQGVTVRYGNLANAVRDENTIFFGSNEKKWREIKDYIESRIMASA